MKIKPISNIKSRSVSIKESLAKELEEYAKFLTAEEKTNYEVSDIISALLLDDKILNKIESENQTKISLKLPEKAWENFDNKTKETGLQSFILLDEICSTISRDRSFQKWKNNQP